jgi:hypothetical protein
MAQYHEIMRRRTKLLEAFIAETGLPPSRCVQMQKSYEDEGGKIIFEFWIEKK